MCASLPRCVMRSCAQTLQPDPVLNTLLAAVAQMQWIPCSIRAAVRGQAPCGQAGSARCSCEQSSHARCIRCRGSRCGFFLSRGTLKGQEARSSRDSAGGVRELSAIQARLRALGYAGVREAAQSRLRSLRGRPACNPRHLAISHFLQVLHSGRLTCVPQHELG